MGSRESAQRIVLLALAAMWSIALEPRARADDTAYIVTFTSQFGTVDLTNGQFTQRGVMGEHGPPRGLGEVGGILYIADSSPVSNIYSVDPSSGKVMLLGSAGIFVDDLGSTTSGLYAIDSSGNLYSIALSGTNAGLATEIGSTGLNLTCCGNATAMSAGSSTLYLALGIPGTLYRLDTTGGAAVQIGESGAIGFGIGAMAFENGTLYGAGFTTLYEINTTNGVGTFIKNISGGAANVWGLAPFTGCQVTVSPCITNPKSGAFPHSLYVALSGVGAAGSTIDIYKDGSAIAAVVAEADGTWESVVDAGLGPHIMGASYAGVAGCASPPVRITNDGTPLQPLVPRSTFTEMRTADIILTHGLHSIQTTLYGPTYTHAALFLGGDSNGTPLIAEAVPSGETGGSPEVRSLPLEPSTVFTDGMVVNFFRPLAALDAAGRTAVAAAAAGYTAQGLHYWTLLDFGAFGAAWLWWNPTLHTPRNPYRFSKAEADLLSRKTMTVRFICSTLVWRAYFDATGGAIDISVPNNLTIATGVLKPYVDPAFLQAIGPDFVFPDTIGLNTSVVYKVP
jgi:hypothetical protein